VQISNNEERPKLKQNKLLKDNMGSKA